jgi:hypothetical protein
MGAELDSPPPAKRKQIVSEKSFRGSMNMNISPWIIEALVEYEKDRIQRDIQRIRLEEEATEAGRAVENMAKSRFSLPHLLTQIESRFVKWMFWSGNKFTDTPPKSKSGYRASG